LGLVLVVGIAVAVLIIVFPNSGYHSPTGDLLNGILQWLHVFFGITWIGLLYYFNFVQTPVMPTVPAELKPGVSKYIAPKALFYFRWGAAFTVLTECVSSARISKSGQMRKITRFGADDAPPTDSASSRTMALIARPGRRANTYWSLNCVLRSSTPAPRRRRPLVAIAAAARSRTRSRARSRPPGKLRLRSMTMSTSASSPFSFSSSMSGRAMTVRSSTRGSNDARLADFLAAGLRDPAPSDRSGMS